MRGLRLSPGTQTMKTFEYRSAQAGDRGPLPKQFVQTLIDTGRFFRSARGHVLFLASTRPFDEFVAIARRDELRAILESGEVLQLTGDELDADDYQGMWFWLSDFRWKLPSVNARQTVQA